MESAPNLKRKLEEDEETTPKKQRNTEYEVFVLKNNKELKRNQALSNKHYYHYEYTITDLDDIIHLGDFYQSNDYDKSKHTNIPFYTMYRLKKPIEKLLNMVGLKSVKKEILSLVVYYLQHFDGENQDMLHTVVYGGPGVGKTKFINILSEIYAFLGVLPTKKVTFAKRADLVGQYLGQTAIKTKQLIEDARGGILVIDEAYSLGDTEQRDSFSRECIDTLNQYLSENKKDLVCVIAGYKEDLEKRFFKTNPGLERRFPFKFTIPDYSPKELKDIFYSIVKENKWDIDKDAISEELLKEHRQCFEFNGGDMEVLFTRTKFIHSMRVFSCVKKDKKRITKEDFEEALKQFTNSDTQKSKKDKDDFIKSLYI